MLVLILGYMGYVFYNCEFYRFLFFNSPLNWARVWLNLEFGSAVGFF